MSENGYSYEQAYLDSTRAFIKRQLDSAGESLDKARGDLIVQRRYVWDNRYVLKSDEAQFEETEMGREMRRFKITMDEAERLRRLYDKPFFARIDFRQDGEPEPEPLYIGQGSVFDTDTFVSYVYDWRAPISSLYYDHECGRASYLCPSGEIHGDITLKRQFEIEKGAIIAQFDTQVAISDALLQSILIKGASSRMHDIVATIQRGQNAIIRDDTRVMIVDGVAGSGKTSIALHRIAYMLYKRRQTLKASQVIIFSPNEIFSDYISQVLPSLGEENVWQTSFDSLSASQLPPNLQKQSLADWLEDVFDDAADSYALETAAIKFSDSFARGIEAFMQGEQSRFSIKADAVFADCGVIIPAAEMNEIYKNSVQTLSMYYSTQRIEVLFFERLNAMKKEIIDRWTDELEETEPFGAYLSREDAGLDAKARWEKEFEAAKVALRRLLRLEPISFYSRYLAQGVGSDARERFRAAIRRGMIPYEDTVPLLWLRCRLGLMRPDTNMRHVIVDEAQDYSLLHYMMLKRLYPRSGFTVLGDSMQCVNPAASPEGLSFIGEAFDGGAKIVSLDKTYRLTAQICAYANSVGGSLTDALSRQGEEVVQERCATQGEAAEKIEGFFGSVGGAQAVITCTFRQAALLKAELCRLGDYELLSGKPSDEISGKMIMPYYLAKGLEFDDVAVMIPENPGEKYAYICSTRAIKRLMIING